MASRLLAVTVGLLAIGLVAACGDDDDDDTATPEATEAGAEPNDVAVEATEFEFILDGEFTTGTTGLTLTNTGQQDHEARIFAIPAAAVLEEVLASEIDAGEVQFPAAHAGPGFEDVMVFEEPLLPGRYLLLCFITDPASGQEHVQLGMVVDFTVE
jgi:hypothetical protein